ncbi:TRAP-type C4-dicarboxylate transport system permease small subunit [Bradyrhizobium japonicum]
MDSRRVPLTRNPRYARIPASPRKRGEAKDRGWIESENDITRETPMKRSWMDRIIDTIEWIAAGFVGIVALDIFLSVLLRNTLNYSIPDSFDIGRMLLGILIFWGIAATSYRGTHITVDLVWGNVGPRYQRWIDVFATLVLLFVVTVQTWTLFDKVRGTYNDNVQTFDMHMPTWPFFAVAWIGDAAAVLLIAIRTYRLIFHPEDMHDLKLKATE